MRKAFFDSVAKFEPYTALYQLGADPAAVKAAIVRILGPYIQNRDHLDQYAVSYLSVEAITIGTLIASPESAAILETCFATRKAAIAADVTRSFEIAAFFEHQIVEAQKTYALLVSFELSKDDLSLEEFAFELLRSIGTLVESNLQPYLKELHCLGAIASGSAIDIESVSRADFGQVCEWMEGVHGGDSSLLTPRPWGIRLNQWRNIAQHHSFTCVNNKVLVRYGKGRQQNEANLSRSDLLKLARELVSRLGALKTSRALTHFNHIEQLRAHLPAPIPHPYNDATVLAASFATQGFRLSTLDLTDTDVLAVIEDTAPGEGLMRPIHCSQFVGCIAERFPNRSVRIHYVVKAEHKWTFSAKQDALAEVMALEDPLEKLAHVVQFQPKR